MTNKEAIEILDTLIYGIVSPKEEEALNLAIEALEQQLKCGCNTCEYYPMKDQRPQGKWVRYRDNPHQPEHIKCSNCGQYWSIADHDKIFDICFKCGADMRKGEKNG